MATSTGLLVNPVDMTRPVSGTLVMRAYAFREVVPRIRYERILADRGRVGVDLARAVRGLELRICGGRRDVLPALIRRPVSHPIRESTAVSENGPRGPVACRAFCGSISLSASICRRNSRIARDSRRTPRPSRADRLRPSHRSIRTALRLDMSDAELARCEAIVAEAIAA